MRPVLVFLPGNMCDARLWQAIGDFPEYGRIDADLAQLMSALLAAGAFSRVSNHPEEN